MIKICPENDFLSPVIKLTRLPNTDEITIILRRIGKSMVIYSLYGTSIDNYIESLLKFRASDQKTTADITTKEIFKHVFDPRTKLSFNVIIFLEKDKDESEVSSKSSPDRDSNQPERGGVDEGKIKYESKAEIDVMIKAVIFPFDEQSRLNKWNEGYVLVEIKLFTAPIEKRDKALLPLLQAKNLSSYFELRHLFSVIGTSYLSNASPNNNDPVAWSKEEYEANKDKPLWISHLILMDARVLSEYKNSPSRATAILSAIGDHQELIQARIGFNRKKYKFKLIYNYLKVLKMTQRIVVLEENVK
ncbi:MAG: hypothetical protein ACTSXP_13210, partial [Promethearchaeota archaeon]